MSESEQRKRHRRLPTRWTDEEFAELTRRADALGLSRNAYIRLKAIGDAGPRSQKVPRAGTKDLAKLLAEVNKIGSNINQIARALNRGRDFEKEFAHTLVDRIRELQDLVRDELDRGR
jgi:hypothetical protein